MTKTNVFTALAKAQSKMSAPAKDAVNQHFRNTYADLASVVEAVAPALNSEGIAFFNMIEDGAMVTVLHHGESDTEIRCAVPLIVQRNDMQGFKSATTYAKRIGLESVTGVAPDDDDGNDAAKARPQTGPRPVENAPPQCWLGQAKRADRIRRRTHHR